MVKHVVLFKLKEFSSQEEKSLKISEIKSGLEALINLIPELKKIQVNININPNEESDICLETEHEDMDGLKAYVVHPEHITVAKTIREVLEKRSCVDYLI